ncbi:MAG: ABC transporter permease [Actinomycetes bacterium]|nr:ABC transporter permease [Actinomycetes bacterium]
MNALPLSAGIIGRQPEGGVILFGEIITYFADNGGEYMTALGEHLLITASAVLVACAIGIPAGILCCKNRVVRTFVTGIFSTLRIVPSLAVLFLCISLIGTGLWPAVVALTLLAIPPLLINTTLGFSGIDPAVIETAHGMGMGRTRTFWQVKLPLALPLVFTGFKTATIEVIASATLGAYIGAGGLGTIIYTGLGLMRNDLLVIGGASVAALSIISGLIISRAEQLVLPWRNVHQVG